MNYTNLQKDIIKSIYDGKKDIRVCKTVNINDYVVNPVILNGYTVTFILRCDYLLDNQKILDITNSTVFDIDNLKIKKGVEVEYFGKLNGDILAFKDGNDFYYFNKKP